MNVWLEYSHTALGRDTYRVIAGNGNEPMLIYTTIGVATIWDSQRGKVVTRVWNTKDEKYTHSNYEHTDHVADQSNLDWALEVVIQKLVERKLK